MVLPAGMKRVRAGKQFGPTIGRVVVEPSDAPKQTGRPRSLEILALNCQCKARSRPRSGPAGRRPPWAHIHQAIRLRNPTTGSIPCCARAASGHATAQPSSVMKLRRFIQPPSLDHLVGEGDKLLGNFKAEYFGRLETDPEL